MGPGAMGHKGLLQMGPMGCYRGPWGSPDGGPWVPWAITVPPQASMAPCDPSHGTHFAPIGLIGKSQPAPWPRSTSFARAPWVTRDPSKWVPWGAIRGMGPMGHHNAPPSPRNCCACHQWPHATHPMGPISPQSGSSERANGHHGHDRLHLKGLHGSQGTHPNWSHGVL
jgi:hypothetical protein